MVRPKGNQEKKDNGDRYKGVRMRKWGKWVAEVRQPKSRDRIWLGSYDTAEEAARAYDAAVVCLRGPSATINFPNNPPLIPSSGPNCDQQQLSPSQIQVAASRHARRICESAVGTVFFKDNNNSEFGCSYVDCYNLATTDKTSTGDGEVLHDDLFDSA